MSFCFVLYGGNKRHHGLHHRSAPYPEMNRACLDIHRAKTWIVGDHVSTDHLAPRAWMSADLATLVRHCLHSVIPEFAPQVQRGDVIVAGHNFGTGSSREQAVEALQYLGIRAVVAQSFAGLFFRNAINLGLHAIECPRASELTNATHLSYSVVCNEVRSLGLALPCVGIPQFMQDPLLAGGILPQLKAKFAPQVPNVTDKS